MGGIRQQWNSPRRSGVNEDTEKTSALIRACAAVDEEAEHGEICRAACIQVATTPCSLCSRSDVLNDYVNEVRERNAGFCAELFQGRLAENRLAST